MGLFGKEKKQKEVNADLPELPELPELPDLPDLDDNSPHQLPSLPDNEVGKKFSQNMIKEAVTGKKEVEDSEADDSGIEEFPKMPEPPRTPLAQEVPIGFKEAAQKVKEVEPIFIRIDKFEKAMDAFEKTKNKIAEIEKTLQEIKELKDQEESELENWTSELQTIKQQIEKVDVEIFSKIN